MKERNIIADLASVGVTIEQIILEHEGSSYSRQFVITSKIHKDSPFTHPQLYSMDYPQKKMWQEVGEYWARRLGYGYKTVFGAI